jgi:hypothetical protein
MLTGLRQAAPGPHEPVPGKPGHPRTIGRGLYGRGWVTSITTDGAMAEKPLKYDEYQGFSGVLEHIDRSWPAADQAGDADISDL